MWEGKVKLGKGIGEGKNTAYPKEKKGGQERQELNQAVWKDCCDCVPPYHIIFRSCGKFGQCPHWRQWIVQDWKCQGSWSTCSGITSESLPSLPKRSPLTSTTTNTHRITQSCGGVLGCLSCGSELHMVLNKEKFPKPTTAGKEIQTSKPLESKRLVIKVINDLLGIVPVLLAKKSPHFPSLSAWCTQLLLNSCPVLEENVGSSKRE